MILKLFLFWRIGLLAVTYLGTNVFQKIENGSLGAVAPNKEFNFLASLAQWDGGHFLEIAQKGYTQVSDTPFFPLYPLLGKLLAYVLASFASNTFSHLLSLLIISNISFILFLYLFFAYVKKNFSQKTAQNAVVTFLVFPTAFIAVLAYSESLFLLLTTAALFALSKKSFLLASVFAGLASLTRFVGIFLLFSIFYKYFSRVNFRFKFNKNFAFSFISIFGFVSYSAFLLVKFKDPFGFFTTQSAWSREINDPISTIASYIWAIIFRQSRPFMDYFDLSITLIFVIVLIWGIKKIPSYLWIFSILVLLIPASTNTLTSMPRYLLASLGAFIIIAKFLEEKPRLKFFIWGLSLSIQVIFAVRFLNGFWVA